MNPNPANPPAAIPTGQNNGSATAHSAYTEGEQFAEMACRKGVQVFRDELNQPYFSVPVSAPQPHFEVWPLSFKHSKCLRLLRRLFQSLGQRDINKAIKQVDLSNGEEAKLQGEIIFEDVLKEQRKHRFSANRMDFDFNRRCDQFFVGNQKDGALLVSVITPLADGYELYDKSKCLLESSAEGGYVLIRLGNDESLGRELRVYLQTRKYTTTNRDGSQAPSVNKILKDLADENILRRERLTALLSRMLAEAEYFVAGQPLKLKASTPMAALDEAMEYLIQNTFSKMSYLKRISAEPAKEIQATLRSNDIAKENLLFQTGENNPEAIEDLRSYLQLCSMKSQQVGRHPVHGTARLPGTRLSGFESPRREADARNPGTCRACRSAGVEEGNGHRPQAGRKQRSRALPAAAHGAVQRPPCGDAVPVRED